MPSYDLQAAQEKLRSNAEKQEHLHDFISGFADRLNGEENAQGLAMALMLFVYDVERGVDGFTGLLMPGRLARFPKKAAGMMAILVAHRLSNFFPEPLASEAAREYRIMIRPDTKEHDDEIRR